jgi:Skp family chaperone for outer membrane proteins
MMTLAVKQRVVSWLLLIVSSNRFVRSFQPQITVQSRSYVISSSDVRKVGILEESNTLQNSIHRRQPHDGSIQTSLRMGIVEDFLAGSDASQRDAENTKYIAELQKRVARINALESTIEDLGDDELEQKTNEFRTRIQQNKESINGPLLEEAFAVVREAAWYVLMLR